MSEPASPPKASSFNVSRWAIDHPYPVIAFFLGVLICAVIAVFTTPRRLMPYVESPMIGIVSMMPGLSAEEMETYISKPVEERMVAIPNVRYIRSTSQDGFSIVSLEFPYGTDMKRMLVSVQALLNVVQADLPSTGANLKPSWVLLIDPLNTPVLTLALGGDNRWNMASLRQLADNEIVNRLKAASADVYAVGVFGGYRRQLQVVVSRNKLASYGLSILTVRDALDKNNVARPAGQLTGGSDESIVRLDTLAQDAHTVESYPLTAVGDRVVYIKDVARVVDTYAELRSGVHHYHDGKAEAAIAVNVLQNPDASSPRVVAAVNAELLQLEHDYPGIHFDTSYDNSRFVGILMRNMFEELGVAVVLTGIVVLLFLGDWRGTVISMITIPTALAMALIGMVALGLTLNSSTLIGLLLSIGRLVDDSIIDIHAVERHLAMGKNRKDATVDGITEVRLAVAASTLMLILALTPLLFAGGIVQQMFSGLVWPMILGLIASFFISLTLTALLAANLLATPEQRKTHEGSLMYRYLLGPVQRFLTRMERGYERLIGWLLHNRFVNLLRILATIVIGFGFYYFIGTEMMPLADVGQAFLRAEMQPGTSYAGTEAAARQVEALFAKSPEIEHASIEIGSEPMLLPYFTGYGSALTNGFNAMITLSDKSQRKRSVFQISDSLEEQARATIPGLRVFQMKEMGADVMASSSAPIQILVYGRDPVQLDGLARRVADVARQVPGLHQVATSWTVGNPDYELHVDPRRAAEIGLSVDDVASQAYYALKGGYTNEFYRLPNRRQTTVLVRFDGPQRTPNRASLDDIPVVGTQGRTVLLSSLATVTQRLAPSVIEHDAMRRVIGVTGFYRPGGPFSMDLTMSVMMKAQMGVNWPPGYGMEVRGDMTQMADSFRRLEKGLMLAMVFILLVLVAQFGGFLQPLQMIFSLPLELSGVFLALWLNAQAFSTVSIMAVIVVTGMDVTTAILLIDQIMRLRGEGMPRDEAVKKACPQRLRPILMTSIVTMITMIPVAFFPKTGMDAYSPLATVVIGGLAVGTVLSLLDIPMLHTLVDDLVEFLRRHRPGGRTAAPVEAVV